ncbi:putative toxin biosynthesis protein [Aspergillus floccosus]
MDSDYERNFVFTEADGSIVPHLLLFAVQMAALAAPAFPGRRSICCFAIVVLAITANLNRFTDDPGLAQFFSLAWPHYLSVLEKLWFSASPAPERFFWRIDRPEQEGRLMRPFGFSKLVWAFVIWFNLRGIRWNYQVKNIPEGPPPTQGKWAFVRGRVIAFIRLLLMADVLSQLATTNFYTSPDGSVGAVNSRYLTTRHSSFACQVYRTASVGLIPYTFMNLQYVGGAILWVTLGISQPADWPPFFGKLSQVTSVRAFWGKYWHQMIRRTVNVYTGAAVDSLGLRPGLVRTYVQLGLSFAISGVMHAAAIYICPSPLNIPFRERSLGFFQFFMLQAAAITFEDFVQYCADRWIWTGVVRPRWVSCVAYTWVVGWFAFSLPYFLDIMLKMKAMEKPMLPVSVMKPVVPYLAMCPS